MQNQAASGIVRLGDVITSADTFLEFTIDVGNGLTGTRHTRRLWKITPGWTTTVRTCQVDVTGQFPTIKFRSDDDLSQRRKQLMLLIDGLLYHKRRFSLETLGGSCVLFTIEATQDEEQQPHLYVVEPREKILTEKTAEQRVGSWRDFWFVAAGLTAAAALALTGIGLWYIYLK